MYKKIILTNSKSPVPAPTSAFLSPPAGPEAGTRLYAVRSSAGRPDSARGPAAGRGLAVSGLV